jgi:voltage-gated potassium channel
MADEVPPAPQSAPQQPAPETARFDAWNARMERPLLVASVLFVVVLCLPILATDLPDPVLVAVRAANLGIWAFFTLDYVVRLRHSPDRKAFVRTHLLDLFIVAVPFFRPLRLLRLLSVANRMGRQNRGNLVADVTKLVTGAAVLTALLGAVLALDAERDAKDSVITNFADSLWWAVGTMTAVPYGDVYPVTQQGRIISGVLMVLGLVLVGLITAAIAAWFVQYIGHEEELEEALASESAALREVNERLATMEALLADLAARPVPVQRKGPNGA